MLFICSSSGLTQKQRQSNTKGPLWPLQYCAEAFAGWVRATNTSLASCMCARCAAPGRTDLLSSGDIHLGRIVICAAELWGLAISCSLCCILMNVLLVVLLFKIGDAAQIDCVDCQNQRPPARSSGLLPVGRCTLQRNVKAA